MVVAVTASLIAGACTLTAAAIGSRNGSSLGGVLAPPTSVATVTLTTQATATETATITATATVTEAPTASRTSQSAASVVPQLLLTEIPRDAFVKRSSSANSRPVTMHGETYPDSYSYHFSNCSNCTSSDEFSIPAGYTHMSGKFGLTDESRHDDVIDGIVYASIFVDGNRSWGPIEVEFPAVEEFDFPFSGNRISLRVENGTNYETVAWADVTFS